MKIDIGISEADRKGIAEGLSKLLADNYTLYLKTQNYHWNVTGNMFQTLHQLFENQYQDLAAANDELAERIRALGFPAPGSFASYNKLSSVKDATGVPKAEDMVKELIADNETVIRTARSILPLVEKAGDQPTMDLIADRMQVHEKTAWMLRSIVE